MERIMRIALMLAGILLLMASCYRTTEDDDLRRMPVTNNPNITPHRDSGLVQGMPY